MNTKWKCALVALMATMIVVASTAFAAAQEKKPAPPAASADLKIGSPEELGEYLQATSVTLRSGRAEGSGTVARIDNGRIYAIRPSRPADIKLWEGTLYSDEEAEESPCTNRAISPTVSLIASVAVWKLIKPNMVKNKKFSFRPPIAHVRNAAGF